MDVKKLTRFEVKDADKGEVAAVFSAFDVIDSDGDVTLKGAFEDGAPVAISAYGHATSYGQAMPVGKGTIRETKSEAIMDGRFFLDTPEGAATFTVVKEMGDLQEWSYGYRILDSSPGEHDEQRVRLLKKLAVNEVSPVLKGAGVGTRTLTVKSGLKFSEHVESVMADMDVLLARASEVVALRAEKGKTISDESVDLLRRLDGDLKGLVDRFAALLAEPATPPDNDEVAREYARFVALTQGVTT